MPNRKKHERISKKFLGKPYTEVHKAIDRPFRRARSRRRRFKLLSHHPFFAALIGLMVSRDKFAWVAGLLHAATDQISKMNKLAKRLDFRLRRT